MYSSLPELSTMVQFTQRLPNLCSCQFGPTEEKKFKLIILTRNLAELLATDELSHFRMFCHSDQYFNSPQTGKNILTGNLFGKLITCTYYYIWYIRQFDEVKKSSSINFEFQQNRFRGNVPCIKRSISTEGIRNLGKFDLPNSVLVWLHKVSGL